MSSLRELLETKGLLLYEEDGEPHRKLWITRLLEQWLHDELPHAEPPEGQEAWRGEIEPCEQVAIAFNQYAYNPAYRNVNLIVNLRPQRDGTWEFKTDDVRVFGWFYRPRVFVAYHGALKGNLTAQGYKAFQRGVVAFRQSLQLPSPAYIYNQRWLPRDYL